MLREVNSFLKMIFYSFINSSLYTTSPLISKENINAEMCAFKNRDGLGLPSWLIQFLLLAISTLSPWLLLFRMHSVPEKWKYIEGMVQ